MTLLLRLLCRLWPAIEEPPTPSAAQIPSPPVLPTPSVRSWAEAVGPFFSPPAMPHPDMPAAMRRHYAPVICTCKNAHVHGAMTPTFGQLPPHGGN
ncbi:hypothetical protein GCM10010214_20640 [Streptomyces abikoensis]|nr:hypothetical protein GCM10010214_20640 [Streptomyces abikoensis]